MAELLVCGTTSHDEDGLLMPEFLSGRGCPFSRLAGVGSPRPLGILRMLSRTLLGDQPPRSTHCKCEEPGTMVAGSQFTFPNAAKLSSVL